MSKIKLIVYNEHTLGFIFPEIPNNIQVLHASSLRGACSTTLISSLEPFTIADPKKVRLASEKDFEDYGVCFKSYKNDPQYEYQHS